MDRIKINLVSILLLGGVLLSFPTVYASGPATLTLGSSSRSVEVGQTFSVNLNINPNGSSVDTARADLTYSNNLISATTVSLAGRLDSASPGNKITAGSISWGGFTVDNPMTSGGLFARVNFEAKTVGTATIAVLGSSKLINNGEEVGNPAGFGQITIQVVPSTADPATKLGLTSPTHPDQTKWYQADTVALQWNNTYGSEYLWELDQNASTTPTKPISGNSKVFKNIKSGVWYFHLSPINTNEDEPLLAHYKLQIDNTKPNPIEPYLDISNRSELTVRFATTDYHSGISSYDIFINNSEIENVVSPYSLRDLIVGTNLISITAFDFAGNSRAGWVKFTLDPDGTVRDITTSGTGVAICDVIPQLCTVPWWWGIVGLLIVFVVLLLRRRVNVMKVNTKLETNVGTIQKTVTKTDPKTGKKLVTKTITKTDMKNIVETDTGHLTADEVEDHHQSQKPDNDEK